MLMLEQLPGKIIGYYDGLKSLLDMLWNFLKFLVWIIHSQNIEVFILKFY